jgi:hypothetical protein
MPEKFRSHPIFQLRTVLIYFGFTLILSVDLGLAKRIILKRCLKGRVDVDWIHVTKDIKQAAGYFE